jgi:hypothetical protein
MFAKTTFLVGTGVAYVLGTRAGREQYDKIMRAGRKLGNQPTVAGAKEKATDVTEKVMERGQEMLAEAKDSLGG